MDWLADDLLLLCVKPDKGYLATADRIDYGLMGSELVRLAMAGRIDIRKDRAMQAAARAASDAAAEAARQAGIAGPWPPR